MSSNWKTIFTGTIDNRPVVLKEYEDEEGRALRVETNYGTDQIIGDGIEGVIGLPVSADDEMRVEASTPDELAQNLIDGGFSSEGAKEIARLAEKPAL